jgi:subtilisin-like proprotein convertase family protein
LKLMTKIYATLSVTPYLITFFCLYGLMPVQAQGNCDCTNCPQFMPDNFTGSFLINVQNASNETLGQNGQGVCGVILNFDHEYLGDLRIVLTSPSGQSVTLVGPIGLFGGTDFSSWNVSFVPCSEPTAPDPGFSGVWNNNQAWGLNGTYTGTYHPATGCLENFNTGPVNGTWSLVVTDEQAVDVGNFYDYEIIFCDPSGIECFSCAANAGELPQPDVTRCEGDPSLDLTLPPTYTVANPAPSAAQYSYTYVISGPGGVIEAFDPAANLTSYPPGVYSVCGMSYATSQAGDIPEPDGSLTVNQLRTLLNGTMAPFCGKITTNCVNVTINAGPEDVEEFVEICAPDCYFFFNQNYCNSGTYVRNLTQNGCPYTATLHLTVFPVKTSIVNEVICQGGCSNNPAFPDACSTGSYFSDGLQTSNGCDSIITLNLTVAPIVANINNTPTVPCGNGTAVIQGLGSTAGVGVTYTWTASNGGNIVGAINQINATVNEPGDYQLKVCRVTAAGLCCDSTEINVEEQTTLPNAPNSISGSVTPCTGVVTNYSFLPVSGATSYTWTFPNGVTVNSGGTANATIAAVTWPANSTGGEICVVANNSCGSSDPTCIDVTPAAGLVLGAPTGNVTLCSGASAVYTVPAAVGATTYNWTVPAPNIITAGQGTNTVTVQWNGTTNANVCVTATGPCGNSTQQCLPVEINSVPLAPNVSGNASVCGGTSISYTTAAITGVSSYNWTVTGGVITAGAGTNTVQVTWNPNVTTGQVCVTATNGCGNSIQDCENITVAPPLATAVISGNNTLCAGNTAIYSVASITGATTYNWTSIAGRAPIPLRYCGAARQAVMFALKWVGTAAPIRQCVSR